MPYFLGCQHLREATVAQNGSASVPPGNNNSSSGSSTPPPMQGRENSLLKNLWHILRNEQLIYLSDDENSTSPRAAHGKSINALDVVSLSINRNHQFRCLHCLGDKISVSNIVKSENDTAATAPNANSTSNNQSARKSLSVSTTDENESDLKYMMNKTKDGATLLFQCASSAAAEGGVNRQESNDTRQEEHIFLIDLSNGELYCSLCGDYIYSRETDSIRTHALIDRLRSMRSNVGMKISSSDPDILKVSQHKTKLIDNQLPTPTKRSLHKKDSTKSIKSNNSNNKNHKQTQQDISKQYQLPFFPIVPGIGLRGLCNMGNTCFMNSVLQVLIHLPILRRYFLLGRHNRKCRVVQSSGNEGKLNSLFYKGMWNRSWCNMQTSQQDKEGNGKNNQKKINGIQGVRELDQLSDAMESDDPTCFGCEFEYIFSEMYAGSNSTKPLAVNHMLFNLWQHSPALAGYLQQDAQEFYSTFVNVVHSHTREYKEVPNTQTPSNIESKQREDELANDSNEQKTYANSEIPTEFAWPSKSPTMDIEPFPLMHQSSTVSITPHYQNVGSMLKKDEKVIVSSPMPKRNQSSGAEGDNSSSTTTPLCSCVMHSTLGGILKSQIQCMNCQAISSTFEPFFDISLDLSHISFDEKVSPNQPDKKEGNQESSASAKELSEVDIPNRKRKLNMDEGSESTSETTKDDEMMKEGDDDEKSMDTNGNNTPETIEVITPSIEGKADQSREKKKKKAKRAPVSETLRRRRDKERQKSRAKSGEGDDKKRPRKESKPGEVIIPISSNELAIDLIQCLSAFSAPERMTGAEKVGCDSCGSRQESIKKLSFHILPPVICFHLKRFKSNGSLLQLVKTNREVRFPLTGLDLRSFSSGICTCSIQRESKESSTTNNTSNSSTKRKRRGGSSKNDESNVNSSCTCFLYDLHAVVQHSGTL